jgi:anthranilate phosphoribosyltransferase
LGGNTVAEFYQDRGFSVTTLDPGHYPVSHATLADLAGADRIENARLVEGILRGTERGPKREAVLLNAGAALFVAGKSRSLLDGWELAAAVIDDGAAWAKLEALRQPGG